MKKTLLVLIVVVFFLSASFPSMAEGIVVSSDKGDLIKLFESIDIKSEKKGNVIAVFGDVNIESKVDGIVVAVFGDMVIDAEVTEQAVTIFGNTRLLKNAKLGSIITLGSVEKAEGSVVQGSEVKIFGEVLDIDINEIMYLQIAIVLLFFLAVLVLGLLIIVVNRKKYEGIADRVEYSVDRKLILGLLAFIGISILTAMLSITLIAPVIYFIILVLASVMSSIFAGRLILKALSPSKNIFAEFITGLITITLVKLLIINLTPHNDLIPGLIMLGIFELFTDSLGLGILMEARAAKNRRT